MAMKGNVQMAVRNLRRNKTRSLLTMLGVIIGVMSVVLAVGISEGIKARVGSQAEHLGKDLILVRPGRLTTQGSRGIFGASDILSGLYTGGSVLSSRDIDIVGKATGIASSVGLGLVQSGVTSSENSKALEMPIVGTSPNFPIIQRQTLTFGSFFTDDPSMTDKVVLGSRAASALYTEHVPLGQTLSILGHQFIVIGILNDFQAAPLANDVDFNNAVFIGYSSAEAITNNHSPIYEVLARPADQTQTDLAITHVRSNLLAAHGGQQDFSVMKQSDTLSATNEILSLLTLLIAGIAGISLIVGGVGIMNVMLVSITERMHEIGIRKALGATDGQILAQFITEATVLSFAGCLIGLFASFITAGALALVTSFTPIITWQIVVVASVASLGVGVVFGSLPALKAARKDPIAALRNE